MRFVKALIAIEWEKKIHFLSYIELQVDKKLQKGSNLVGSKVFKKRKHFIVESIVLLRVNVGGQSTDF